MDHPLYHKTYHIIQEIQHQFQQLNSAADPDAVANDILTKIAAANANCDRLDVLVYKVPVTTRHNAKMRVDQLKYDLRHLEAALRTFHDKRQRREMELNEREQLLSRRFTANSPIHIDIDHSVQHHNSMQNAHRGVDDMISSGSNILENLRNQRDALKNVHRRIMDIGNTLGLSNDTMRMIERRVKEDKVVMIAGMGITLLIIVLILYYFL